jgi:hypothetical protein
MLLSKTFCQEQILYRAGEGYFYDPTSMYVSNFCLVEEELTSPKTVRMNRYMRPC